MTTGGVVSGEDKYQHTIYCHSSDEIRILLYHIFHGHSTHAAAHPHTL